MGAQLLTSLNLSDSKTSGEIIPCYSGQTIQVISNDLPSCRAALAQIASRFPGCGGGLFFSKRAAHFRRRRGDQCAALCAASSRSPEPLHLLGTSRRSRKYPDYFSGGHAIGNGRDPGIQIRNRRARRRSGRHRSALLLAGRLSRVAEGPASAASKKSSTHCWRASELFIA